MKLSLTFFILVAVTLLNIAGSTIGGPRADSQCKVEADRSKTCQTPCQRGRICRCITPPNVRCFAPPCLFPVCLPQSDV
ncbi:hypothetical protein C0J52_22179 [Blattella germanica]|nr:hypothetical protein C0J52_22179 [Blattella germanica]